MSRIFVSSDWHLDHVTYGVSRYGDVRQAIQQVVEAAVAEKADLFAFLGDLCDPDDGPAALQAVATAIGIATVLAARGIPSWWIAGNHDVIEDGTGMTTLSPLRALCMPEVHVFEQPEVRAIPGKSLHDPSRPTPLLALPFTAASHRYDPRGVVAKHAKQLGERAVVAGHLHLEGILPGEETTDMPRGRSVQFPVDDCRVGWLKLNGHYHKKQIFRGVHVPGSVARLTFGEEDNKPSYLVVEI
jgi:DNA repair exonuclease SbcCD nuclease subunit